MKKNILAIAMAVIMLGSVFQPVSAFATDDIKVTVNNETISFDVPPQTVNGRTMVPMRAIFEKLGASVAWDDATKTITGTKGNSVVKMVLGSNTMTVNGTTKTLDAPAATISGRTLVPVRAIAESFDCDVAWNNSTRTVEITSADAVKTYTSLEGEWVRVSANTYYGSTMNISKSTYQEEYVGTLTSCLNNPNHAKIGKMNITDVIPFAENTYTGVCTSDYATKDKATNTSTYEKYNVMITVNENFTVMEWKRIDDYRTETRGDYQKWVRITPDTDIEVMQKAAIGTVKSGLYGFSDHIYNNMMYVIRFEKNEANNIIDTRTAFMIEKQEARFTREKIDAEITALNNQITKDERLMGKKSISKAEKDSLQQKINYAKNQIEILEAKDDEERLYLLELAKKEKQVTKKFNELYRHFY